MLPGIFFAFFIFSLGVIVGSFLNVVILRYNTGFSIGGRSHCFSCGKTLQWYELFPIVSFVIQGGRCRGCKSRISLQYPLVEILTGFVFLITFLRIFSSDLLLSAISFSSLLALSYYLFIFCLLIVIAVYDFKHKIIPNGLVYGFIFLSFLKAFFFSSETAQALSYVFIFPSWIDLVSGPILFLPFFLLWFISRGKWIGFGDAKLALGIGWLLGISQGFSALFIGFYAGALVGLGMIVLDQFLKRKQGTSELNSNERGLTMKSEIPFGPFLVLGVFLVFSLSIDFFTILRF